MCFLLLHLIVSAGRAEGANACLAKVLARSSIDPAVLMHARSKPTSIEHSEGQARSTASTNRSRRRCSGATEAAHPTMGHRHPVGTECLMDSRSKQSRC